MRCLAALLQEQIRGSEKDLVVWKKGLRKPGKVTVSGEVGVVFWDWYGMVIASASVEI